MCKGPEAGMGVSYTRDQNESNKLGACGLWVCYGDSWKKQVRLDTGEGS